jgi:hypothetical protein
VSTPGPGPQRVRVTSPRTGAVDPRRVRSVRSEIDDQTQLGEVYMRSLMRTQLRLAFLVIGVLAATVGLLPVLFVLVPETRTTTVLGVPLPWLLLGLVVYPFLVLLGWGYVRRAEHNEQSFSDLVERR